MNRQDLGNDILQLMTKDMEVLKAKNADYAEDDDALSNLRDFGLVGVGARISDKYHRLKTFLMGKAYSVKNESVLDTVGDLRRHCYLFELLFRELGGGEGKEEYNYAEISHGKPERT